MRKPKRVRLVATDEQGIVRGARLWKKRRRGKKSEKKEKAFVFLFKPSLAVNLLAHLILSSSTCVSPPAQSNFTVVEAPALTQLDAMEAVARW